LDEIIGSLLLVERSAREMQEARAVHAEAEGVVRRDSQERDEILVRLVL
jgi:hypothetical protein